MMNKSRVNRNVRSALNGLAILCAALLYTAGANAAPIVVTPGNMDSWAFYKTDPAVTYGSGDAVAEMVTGPGTPPLGTGSAHFNTGSDGFQSAQLRNSAYAGTAIGDLTSLSYSTYATAWNGSQLPYLTIYLSNGDRLWFEPDYSSVNFGRSQPAPALNLWQSWDALGGYWYTDAFFGTGSNAVPWADILTAEGGGVTIVADSAGRGGIRIASGFAGSADNFDANVDAFTIGTTAGTTTYNFELTPQANNAPEPASLALLALGLAGLGLSRRKKA